MSKTWFITGAASDMGVAIARAALKAGDRVAATARNTGKLRSLSLDVNGENVEMFQVDVADAAQVNSAVEQAIARFGRIDVAVNNAGYSLSGNFEELPTAEIERLFATNFWGAAHVMRAVLPVMRKQRSGHIMNICPVAGAVGVKRFGAYGASKLAVEGLSLAVANEVEQFGIGITVVETGFVRTDLIGAPEAHFDANAIQDYAAERSAEAMLSRDRGKQPADPANLGEVLVKVAGMENPPRVFAAGSDALAAIAPAVEERLK